MLLDLHINVWLCNIQGTSTVSWGTHTHTHPFEKNQRVLFFPLPKKHPMVT